MYSFFRKNVTTMITSAGITTALKTALPAVVPMPAEKPLVSFKNSKKKAVVNNSGMELEIAFIVAPLTPSDKFLPIYLDAVSKPLHALQIIKHDTIISKIGTIIPIV